MASKWLFAAEQYPESPDENYLRWKCGDFIINLGNEMLQGQKRTTITHGAMILCQRFYCLVRENTSHYMVIAAACFWLAAAGSFSIEQVAEASFEVIKGKNEAELNNADEMYIALWNVKDVVTKTLLEIHMESTDDLLSDAVNILDLVQSHELEEGSESEEEFKFDPEKLYREASSNLEDLYKTALSVIFEPAQLVSTALAIAGISTQAEWKSLVGVDVSEEDITRIRMKLYLSSRVFREGGAGGASSSMGGASDIGEMYTNAADLGGASDIEEIYINVADLGGASDIEEMDINGRSPRH